MMLKTKSFHYYNSFVDWNQPLEFDEDDAKEEHLDATFFCLRCPWKRIKLYVIWEVILYEAIYNGCAPCVLGENLRIYRIKVDAISFQIKVVNQIFKSYLNTKSDFIVREIGHVVDKYDISNGKTKYVKGWKFLVGHPQDQDMNNLGSRMSSSQLRKTWEGF